MNKVKLFLMDLFFPNRCPVCNNIIVYDSIICDCCRDKLDVSKTEQEIICNIQDDVFYSYVLPGYYYENEARRGVLSLKDGNKNFGYYLGHILAARIMEQENLRNADYIVPIPMSKQRYRERGYNQTYVIAKEISGITGIPILRDVLYKNKSKIQHTLSFEERKKNVKAFYASDRDLSGKKIILCDDVFTTGSTMNRCAELLINLNAAAVYAVAGTIKKQKKE